jgi:hypothetical protein
MEDFTDIIGRIKIHRDETTKRLYELEDEAYDIVKRAAQEHEHLLPDDLSKEEASSFSTADEMFALLDYFRPVSVQAATAFLRCYGYEVTKKL